MSIGGKTLILSFGKQHGLARGSKPVLILFGMPPGCNQNSDSHEGLETLAYLLNIFGPQGARWDRPDENELYPG
jgi:hypothetical protein